MNYTLEELSTYYEINNDGEIINKRTNKILHALIITMPKALSQNPKRAVGMSRNKLKRILKQEPYNHKEHMRKVLGVSSTQIEDYYKIVDGNVINKKTKKLIDPNASINLPVAIVEEVNREHATGFQIKQALLLNEQIKPISRGKTIHDFYAFVPQGIRLDDTTYKTTLNNKKIVYSTVKFGIRVEANKHVLLSFREGKWSCFIGNRIWLPHELRDSHKNEMIARLRMIGWLTFGVLPEERTIRVSKEGVELVDSGLSQSFAGIRATNKSGYKGVCQVGLLWKAYFKRKELGVFKTPEEAYEAHIQARAEAYGQPKEHFFVREMDEREPKRDLDHYVKSGGKKKPK